LAAELLIKISPAKDNNHRNSVNMSYSLRMIYKSNKLDLFILKGTLSRAPDGPKVAKLNNPALDKYLTIIRNWYVPFCIEEFISCFD
jgi:hypothetical protein